MPENFTVTVQDIRDAIIMSLPLAEAIARRTQTRLDDVACVVMRVVATNDEIAKAIQEAIGKDQERQLMMSGQQPQTPK